MEAGLIYNVSLLAAFIAGMVALFAPCCISYLLPAYFANIFKERRKVLLMTLVYSGGILAVMMPIVLGARALAELFFRWHDRTYLVGGGLMVAIGVLAFLGVKLPMPNIKQRTGSNNDYLTTFILGVFSGITSACCAPVLLGVMTLSAFSPSILLGVGVGVAYVLGMVTPLYLASLLIERGNILEAAWLRRQWGNIRLGGKVYPVMGGNVLAAIMFVGTGGLMLFLTWKGMLGMQGKESESSALIQNVAQRVTEATASIPLVNVMFAALLIGGLYWYLRSLFRELKSDDGEESKNEIDCCGDK